MASYHDHEYKEAEVDVEVAVPIAGSIKETDSVKMRELPGGEVATATHRGPYDTIGNAYNAVASWIERNGYQMAGPGREIYLTDPKHAKPSEYVTEIQMPVAKA